MTLSTLLKQGSKVVADHAPALLTALGVSGTVATAVLASKASYQASEVIRASEPDHVGAAGTRKQRIKERFPLVWKLYVPPVTTGVVTVGAIICANRVSAKRVTAAYSLLAMTQQAFSEYQDEITDMLGAKKEQAARDNIIQKKIAGDDIELHNVHIPENQQLCCEVYTGRYFSGTMEGLRKSMNELNAQINQNKYATLDDWYFLIDVQGTQFSDTHGWTSDRGLLDLVFTSALTTDGKAVLAFKYNYLAPVHDPGGVCLW